MSKIKNKIPSAATIYISHTLRSTSVRFGLILLYKGRRLAPSPWYGLLWAPFLLFILAGQSAFVLTIWLDSGWFMVCLINFKSSFWSTMTHLIMLDLIWVKIFMGGCKGGKFYIWIQPPLCISRRARSAPVMESSSSALCSFESDAQTWL